jgi:hypothetical protein
MRCTRMMKLAATLSVSVTGCMRVSPSSSASSVERLARSLISDRLS